MSLNPRRRNFVTAAPEERKSLAQARTGVPGKPGFWLAGVVKPWVTWKNEASAVDAAQVLNAPRYTARGPAAQEFV